MMSPFPGVDPYIEAQGLWPDFYASFITYLRDSVADRLLENYEARIDERVNLIELPAEKLKRIKPDLSISRRERSAATTAPAGPATLEPVTIPLVIEEESRETYIEVLQRPERTLVAVIELLSPSNKEEPGRSLYLAKRNSLLCQPIHVVEIDLLRGGQRLPLSRDYPAGQFFVLVARGDRRPDARFTLGAFASPCRRSRFPCCRPTLTCGSTWAPSLPPLTSVPAMPAPSITRDQSPPPSTRASMSGFEKRFAAPRRVPGVEADQPGKKRCHAAA
jgi:hypothetical protein